MSKDIPIKRVREPELHTLFRLFATWDSLEKVCEDEWFVGRIKSVPGAWRDLRMMIVKVQSIINGVLETIPPEKRDGISRTMRRMRYSLSQGPVASRDKNNHQQVINSWELDAIVEAAHESKCRLCIGENCSTCQLGKALDNIVAYDRDGGSWSMIDIGMSENV